MKFLYLLLMYFVAFCLAQEYYDDFSIQFYSLPSYKQEAGFISGSVAKGGSAGTPRGNMTIRSFKTQSWLQVTLYEKHYYGGASHVFKGGSAKEIKPAIYVQSVKWKHL